MIGIISDIHGNYAALRAVLNRLDELGVEEIICLGDTAGYYCQINECCEALRERKILSLQGNHDWYLSTGERCPRSNSANRCLDYQEHVIRPESLAWLAGLLPQRQFGQIKAVHGGWFDPLDEYIAPSDEYFEKIDGQYFVSGHTHVPYIWHGNGKIYCNPGSVGQPRDGDPRASFAIWRNKQFFLQRIEYPVIEVEQAMRKAGFTAYFYDNLYHGTQIGGKLSRYPDGLPQAQPHPHPER